MVVLDSICLVAECGWRKKEGTEDCGWQTLEEIRDAWNGYKSKLGDEFEWLKAKLQKYSFHETKVVEALQTEIELQDAHKVSKKILKVYTL